MLFWTYFTVPVSEFRDLVVCNEESWEEGDITDPIVLMNDAESKFKILQEDKLWVTNNPVNAKMLDLTTVTGYLTIQLDSKGDIKKPDKPLGNFPHPIGALGNSGK